MILFVSMLTFTRDVDAQTDSYATTLENCVRQSRIQTINSGCMNGVAAPDFVARTIENKLVHLASIKGNVVVMNFWFIACMPCRMEVPALNDLVTYFKNEKVIFISVAIDQAAALDPFLKSHQFNFQTIPDPDNKISARIFHIRIYPTTIIIDTKGKIRFFSTGGKFDPDEVYDDVMGKLIPPINAGLGKKDTVAYFKKKHVDLKSGFPIKNF